MLVLPSNMKIQKKNQVAKLHSQKTLDYTRSVVCWATRAVLAGIFWGAGVLLLIFWVLLCHLNCQRLSHHVSRDSFSERSLFSLALLIHRRPRLHVVRAGRRHHSHHWHHGHFALWGPCLYGYPCNELTSWRKRPAFGNLCACNKPSIVYSFQILLAS